MASSTVILGSLLVALFFPFFFLPDFLPLPDFFLGGITFAVCCRNLWSSYQKFHTTTTTIFKTDDGFGCKGLGAKGHSGEARRRNTWIRPTHIYCFKSRSNKALLGTHSLISILMKRKGLNNSFPISFKQSFYGTFFRFVSKLLAILALIRMGRGIWRHWCGWCKDVSEIYGNWKSNRHQTARVQEADTRRCLCCTSKLPRNRCY